MNVSDDYAQINCKRNPSQEAFCFSRFIIWQNIRASEIESFEIVLVQIKEMLNSINEEFIITNLKTITILFQRIHINEDYFAFYSIEISHLFKLLLENNNCFNMNQKDCISHVILDSIISITNISDFFCILIAEKLKNTFFFEVSEECSWRVFRIFGNIINKTEFVELPGFLYDFITEKIENLDTLNEELSENFLSTIPKYIIYFHDESLCILLNEKITNILIYNRFLSTQILICCKTLVNIDICFEFQYYSQIITTCKGIMSNGYNEQLFNLIYEIFIVLINKENIEFFNNSLFKAFDTSKNNTNSRKNLIKMFHKYFKLIYDTKNNEAMEQVDHCFIKLMTLLYNDLSYAEKRRITEMILIFFSYSQSCGQNINSSLFSIDILETIDFLTLYYLGNDIINYFNLFLIPIINPPIDHQNRVYTIINIFIEKVIECINNHDCIEIYDIMLTNYCDTLSEYLTKDV